METVDAPKKRYSGYVKAKYTGCCQDCGNEYKIGDLIYIVENRPGARCKYCQRSIKEKEDFIKNAEANRERDIRNALIQKRWTLEREFLVKEKQQILDEKKANREETARNLKIKVNKLNEENISLKTENAFLKDDNKILLERITRLQLMLQQPSTKFQDSMENIICQPEV